MRSALSGGMGSTRRDKRWSVSGLLRRGWHAPLLRRAPLLRPSGVQPQAGPEQRGRAASRARWRRHAGLWQGLCCSKLRQLIADIARLQTPVHAGVLGHHEQNHYMILTQAVQPVATNRVQLKHG